MKILKIRFQNIHSLKGEHEIDFANGILAEAGLFAITGPTGSGKSTLLDVITLALYNRIARVDKSVTNSVLEDDGGIMTRNMGSCYAEVDYGVGGNTYRSHWSIERNRNHNLNSRKQELVDVATGTILESGTKTPDKNQEIIRLSYQQFVKAMVLSQGEFSKLLQAPRNERNKLLEDITGAKSYRNIGRAVFQRFATAKKQVELKEAGLESITLLSEEEKKERQAELSNFQTARPKVQKEYESQREQIEIRKQFVEAQKTQKRLAEKAVELKGFFEAFEPDEARLAKHEQLNKYGDALRSYDATQREVQKIGEEQKNIQKALEEEELGLVGHIKGVSVLLGETVAQEDANAKLEAFRSTISRLQAEEKAKKDAAQLYRCQLKALVHKLQQLGYDLVSKESPAEFEKEMRHLEVRLKESVADSGVTSLKELDNELEVVRGRQEMARVVLDKKREILKLEKQLTDATVQLKTEQDKEKENRANLVRLKTEVASLEKEVMALQKSLEHQRKHQSLEAHRLQLTDNEPCPLCGAMEHPYAISKPHFDANEELLKNKESLFTSKGKLIISLEENNKFRLGEMQRIKAEIDQKTKEKSSLSIEVDAVLARLEWDARDGIAVWESKQNELGEQLQKLANSRQAFMAKDVFEELGQPLKAWQQTLSDYEKAKAERTKRYTGANIDTESNSLSTKITAGFASKKGLQDRDNKLKDELKKAEQTATEHQEQLNAILTQEHIENLEGLRMAILPEDIAKKYRDRKSELALWKAKLSEKQTANTDTFSTLKEKDATELSFEQLSGLYTESKEKWESLSMNLGKLSQVLENDEKTRKKFKNEQMVLEQLKKDQLLWKTMNDLIGDANGNKFSNFVQDLTLEQLIGYANRRLAEFTDRYLLDIPTANEAEKSDTLKILDAYMGNARRSVRTLSGGETFLVSLAMAFALSDIASRNVKIESLFIDEGFGTLDPETLDQAITILEKMQHEGDRSVGVISHVGALKERITTQIQLEKSSIGHSHIRVVQ